MYSTLWRCLKPSICSPKRPWIILVFVRRKLIVVSCETIVCMEMRCENIVQSIQQWSQCFFFLLADVTITSNAFLYSIFSLLFWPSALLYFPLLSQKSHPKRSYIYMPSTNTIRITSQLRPIRSGLTHAIIFITGSSTFAPTMSIVVYKNHKLLLLCGFDYRLHLQDTTKLKWRIVSVVY